ncbi:MAG: histidine phosphatase family protein, partial [Phycisphaeraceae bacterium]
MARPHPRRCQRAHYSTLTPDTPYTVLEELREVASFHQRGAQPARTRDDRQRLKREREAMQRFIARVKRHHLTPGVAVLVVGHGNLTRFMLPTLAGLDSRRAIPLGMNNTALTVVHVQPDGGVSVRLANCTRHLPMKMIN